jgi:hypothetical protein
MATGIVIKMKSAWGFKTPNSGTLRDLDTSIEYPFTRPALTMTAEGPVPKWNVELYDAVSFTIAGNVATDVTLLKKHTKGKTIVKL